MSGSINALIIDSWDKKGFTKKEVEEPVLNEKTDNDNIKKIIPGFLMQIENVLLFKVKCEKFSE